MSNQGAGLTPKDIRFVHDCIERCLKLEMTPNQIVDTLFKQHKIDPRFTQTGKGLGMDEHLPAVLLMGGGEGMGPIEATAEKVVPEFQGLHDFSGKVMHVCDYKSGKEFKGKRVLVVGCGNSGMEVSLDLCLHHALPSMVVRSSVHVLPREILGKSTFELGVWMMKWMPVWAVDKVIVGAARLILGNIEKYGLKRPTRGPLEVKNSEGKTPVLDIGTLARIRTGEIKLVCGINRFLQGGVELLNGDFLHVDSVILATGYSTNVPSWLKICHWYW